MTLTLCQSTEYYGNFMENSCKKCAPRGLSKNINYVFLLNPVPFNGQGYEKQKKLGASDQLLFRLQNKFRRISLLVMYYLTKFDDVI